MRLAGPCATNTTPKTQGTRYCRRAGPVSYSLVCNEAEDAGLLCLAEQAALLNFAEGQTTGLQLGQQLQVLKLGQQAQLLHPARAYAGGVVVVVVEESEGAGTGFRGGWLALVAHAHHWHCAGGTQTHLGQCQCIQLPCHSLLCLLHANTHPSLRRQCIPASSLPLLTLQCSPGQDSEAGCCGGLLCGGCASHNGHTAAASSTGRSHCTLLQM